MATEHLVYLSYPEAVALHIELMRYLGETRYGVFERALVESALSRPQQAAVYEQADLIPGRGRRAAEADNLPRHTAPSPKTSARPLKQRRDLWIVTKM